MSDETNRLYEEIIHCTIRNGRIRSADMVALFYYNRHILLKVGLAETWTMTETTQKDETPETIPNY